MTYAPLCERGDWKMGRILREKPLILMTGDLGRSSSPELRQVRYYKNYPEALEAAGAVVLNLSCCDGETAAELAELADGLFLPGGGDISPEHYREKALPQCGAPEEGRDELELTLAQAFLAVKKPILGVCRGLQLLNVALGGTLWQDIPSQLGMEHPDDSIHQVKTPEGSLFRGLFGGEFQVNSFHHQGVKELGTGLLPQAWDETGRIVEAFSHKELPVFATQWHPERMTGRERLTPAGPDMAPLFQFFCGLCRKK